MRLITAIQLFLFRTCKYVFLVLCRLRMLNEVGEALVFRQQGDKLLNFLRLGF